MRGDKLRSVVKLLTEYHKRGDKKIKGCTITRCCNMKKSYGYQLTHYLVKAGYLKRIQNGIFSIEKEPSDMVDYKSLGLPYKRK